MSLITQAQVLSQVLSKFDVDRTYGIGGARDTVFNRILFVTKITQLLSIKHVSCIVGCSLTFVLQHYSSTKG